MVEEKRLWEKISDKGLKIYVWIALTIFIIALFGIILSKFTFSVKIIFIAGIIFIAIISYFLYRLWYKYFYQKFFKKSMYKLEEDVSKSKKGINQKLTFLKIASSIFIFEIILLIILFGGISNFGPFFHLWLFGNPIMLLVGIILIIISFRKDQVEVKWKIARIILLIIYIVILILSLLFIYVMSRFN